MVTVDCDLVLGRAQLHSLRKNSEICGLPWKSGPSGPRNPREISAGFSPGGIADGEVYTNYKNGTSYVLRCKPGIQSRANEDQHGRGQEDDSIVETQSEAARAAGKHESAQGIDDVGQRI